MSEEVSDREIEVYKDQKNQYRWRLVSRRGNLPDEILADSGQGYATLSNAVRAASSVHPDIRVTQISERKDQ